MTTLLPVRLLSRLAGGVGDVRVAESADRSPQTVWGFPMTDLVATDDALQCRHVFPGLWGQRCCLADGHLAPHAPSSALTDSPGDVQKGERT